LKENQIFSYWTPTNKQLSKKLKSKKFNDSAVLAFLECVPSHFPTLAIELHLVHFGLGASFTVELHCSLPTAPLLLLLQYFA